MRPFILFALIFVLSIPIHAQNEGWTVGLEYNPFFYWNYNKKDWNNRPYSHPAEPRSFNGSKAGLRVEKYFKNFGIHGGLFYSSQLQKHISTSYYGPEQNVQVIEDRYYNVVYTRHFNYLHVAMYLNKSLEIGYSSELYLNVSFGIINSFLTNYKTIHLNYHLDLPEENEISNNSRIGIKTIRTKNYGYYLIDPGTENERYNKYDLPQIYSQYTLAFSSQISLSKRIRDQYVIEVGVRGEHDITSSENKKHADLIFDDFGGGWTQDMEGNWIMEQRSPSYNIRLGPFLALKYRFGN